MVDTETARLVRKLVPFDDGSGHRYTVTVSRSGNDAACEAKVSISIESGSEVVAIDINHWKAVSDAVEASVDHLSKCSDVP